MAVTVLLLDPTVKTVNNKFTAGSLAHNTPDFDCLGLCVRVDTRSLCAVSFYIPTSARQIGYNMMLYLWHFSNLHRIKRCSVMPQ